MSTLARRRLVNVLAFSLCGGAVLVALVPLASLLGLVVMRGLPGLDANLFVSLPVASGEPGGGIGNAIAGTLLVVGLACVMGLPVGIGAGVFLAESNEHGALAAVTRFVADVLAGVPSIIVGIWWFSWCAGRISATRAAAGCRREDDPVRPRRGVACITTAQVFSSTCLITALRRRGQRVQRIHGKSAVGRSWPAELGRAVHRREHGAPIPHGLRAGGQADL